MLGWLALASALAAAEDYYLETAPVTDRAAASRMERVAEAVGYDARVVRRFRLGKGWEYVVLVERLAQPEDAAAAATRLERELGVKVSARKVEGDAKAVTVDLPATAAPPAEDGAAAWIARVRAAHGGATGGASALARAGVVHFRFARTVEIRGRTVTVRHDYWRDGTSRRLAVETAGAGMDSLAVATPKGAWVRTGDRVETRDIGVTIGALDAFAPEAVLTVALEAARLLEAPEAQTFLALEGGESGLRFGAGGDESEPGLSFIDVDPQTAQLTRVRYVAEAGPITFELSGWRVAANGVIVPSEVRVERAAGERETYRIEVLETMERAPAGTFDAPS